MIGNKPLFADFFFPAIIQLPKDHFIKDSVWAQTSVSLCILNAVVHITPLLVFLNL